MKTFSALVSHKHILPQPIFSGNFLINSKQRVSNVTTLLTVESQETTKNAPILK